MISFIKLEKLLVPVLATTLVVLASCQSTETKKVPIATTGLAQNIQWAIYTDADDIAEDANDLLMNRLVNDEQFLYFSFENKTDIASWHRHELYFKVNGLDGTAKPLPNGANSLKMLDANYAFRFMINDSKKWVIERYDSRSGAWSAALSSNAQTSSVVEKAQQIKGRIPLRELGSPTAGSVIEVKFVSTGEGWATDESPDHGMQTYVVK